MKLHFKRRMQTGTAILCTLALSLTCIPAYAEDQASLESKTSDLENQLANINQELLDISNQISMTEMQVEITNGEIQRTQDSLIVAQDKEAQQYDNMKSRIKYMYENGSASLLEMLFEAENMSDFLNKADFIQNISDYDRDMLTELQNTKDQITQQQQILQAQQESLQTLQVSLDKQQQDLNDKAAATSTDLSTVQAQLAQLKAEEAARLAAEAAARKAAEEKAAAEAAGLANGSGSSGNVIINTDNTIVNVGSIDTSASELDVFAAILDCEAVHDYTSMLAVATVIMNRVDSSLFPNTIKEVIYAPGQFEPVFSGKIDTVLKAGASKLAYEVAQDAVNGARLAAVNDCYYFLYAGTGHSGINVGGNVFFQSW